MYCTSACVIMSLLLEAEESGLSNSSAANNERAAGKTIGNTRWSLEDGVDTIVRDLLTIKIEVVKSHVVSLWPAAGPLGE